MVEAMEIKAGYKQTEVGIIPIDWNVKKLTDLVDKFVNGGTPSTQIAEYWNGNIPWITGADILNQKVAVIRRYISKEAVKNSSTNIIEKGNLLLVSRTGVGKLSITPFDIAISQDFTGVYVKSSELDTVYLFRYFDFAQKELKTQNQGTSIQGITRETLSSIKIPLPPTKAEQTAIATALNDADALIAQLEKFIAKKRAIKQGAMQELLKPQVGWEVKTLGEVAKYRRGSFPQPYGLDKWYDDHSGFPFVQVFDVDDNMKLKNETKRRISAEAQKFSVFVEKGSILLTIQGSIGRIAITQYDAYVDRTLLLFETFLVPINKYFFMITVFVLFEQEKQKAPGGTIKTITKEALSSFTISIPPIEEQTRIAQILSEMDTEIEALEKKLKKHKMIKQGMMQNLLTGRIRLV